MIGVVFFFHSHVYFQNIRDHDDFKFITSLIPNMMVGLRHIWTMSNYYCRDQNMEVLLHKISYVFTEKVKAIISLEDIFKHSPATVYELADNCATLLRYWKESYKLARSYIEGSGVGSRWEFNKNILFEDVDHIARISQDVANIAKVFIQFENIFSNHLKSIIKEPEEVDIMIKKVYELIQHIVTIDYDVFRPGNLENWEATLEYFQKFVDKTEIEANVVLDRCINVLRSAESGLELIKDVKTMDTRTSVVNHLSKKHESVMRQFVTEVGVVEHEFLKNRKSPPLQRNQPHYIGSIFWERLLYNYLKKSIIAFRKVCFDCQMINLLLTE